MMGLVSKFLDTTGLRSPLLYYGFKFMLWKEYGKDFFNDKIPLSQKQEKMLLKIIRKNEQTVFGKNNSFREIHSSEDFQENVSLSTIDDYVEYLERIEKGEEDVLFPGKPEAWIRTSATGKKSAKPKKIPFYKGTAHRLTLASATMVYDYVSSNKKTNSKALSGKFLTISAQAQAKDEQGNPEIKGGLPVGYISGLAAKLQASKKGISEFFLPTAKVIDIEDWNEKHELMTEEAINENITTIAGVPFFIRNYLKKLDSHLKGKYGKKEQKIHEFWKNLKLVIWSGSRIDPFKSELKELLGDNVDFIEAYGSTEGQLKSYGIIHSANEEVNKGMKIAVHNNFYEFIPLDKIHEMKEKDLEFKDYNFSKVYTLKDFEEDVKKDQAKRELVNKEYAIVLTNESLYRYILGDIVEIYDDLKIRVSGRLGGIDNMAVERMTPKHFEEAVNYLGTEKGLNIHEYSWAKVPFNPNNLHYLVLLETDANEDLTDVLDFGLRKYNEAYDMCRKNNFGSIKLKTVAKETYDAYNNSKERTTGQNKSPRGTDIETIEEIINFSEQMHKT